MFEPNGQITEGLQSNFHVFKKGKIVTAPLDEIVPGAIQNLVIKCADVLNIKVQYDFPRISEIDTWEGAFLASTSRFVLPIDTINLPDSVTPVSLKQNPIMSDLQRVFNEQMRREMVKINDLKDYFSVAHE